jgi:hypothetical protein
VLIGADEPRILEGAISAASLAELHVGVLVAHDEDERARRALRLGVIEATFEPLPIDAAAAREWADSPPPSADAEDSPAVAPSISPSRTTTTRARWRPPRGSA